jgi:hypothetical protein
MDIPKTRTMSGKRMSETQKMSLPCEGVSWMARGLDVLGKIEIRSDSSVSQFTVFRKRLPLPPSP